MPCTNPDFRNEEPVVEVVEGEYVFADECIPGETYSFNPPMLADGRKPEGGIEKDLRFPNGMFLKKEDDGSFIFQGTIGNKVYFFGVELEPGGCKIYKD